MKRAIRRTHLGLTVPAPSLLLAFPPSRPLLELLNVVCMAALSFAAPCFSIHRLAKKPIAVEVVADSERMLLQILIRGCYNTTSGRVEVAQVARSYLRREPKP
jgi:hypothetical protein